jgi:hypothetical protein
MTPLNRFVCILPQTKYVTNLNSSIMHAYVPNLTMNLTILIRKETIWILRFKCGCAGQILSVFHEYVKDNRRFPFEASGILANIFAASSYVKTRWQASPLNLLLICMWSVLEEKNILTSPYSAWTSKVWELYGHAWTCFDKFAHYTPSFRKHNKVGIIFKQTAKYWSVYSFLT